MKTFVFTDVVSSVKLKSQMPGRSDAERDHAYVQSILTPHRQLIEEGLEHCGGRVVSTAGDGHFLVFPNTIQAATWAIDVQAAHRDKPISTPQGDRVHVRMSLHVGFPQTDPNDSNNFIGRVVDYAARLNDYATGGQLLISAAALGLLKDAGLAGVRFHSHGELELKGIGAVEVYELLYDQHGPREIRNNPKAKHRSWSVLPQTMGLTEYANQGSSNAATSVSPAKPARGKRRLGNYELEELLGAGGMGDVYKARHVQFDRTRAVKVIKPHFLESGSDSIIKRFYREIKAVGALDHPNVVVAVDSSAPDDDTHYLVMEYLSGVSADQVVKRGGPMQPADACELIRQAAVGLDYIASKGMVHRDIKPSNLMLTMVRPQAGSLTLGAPEPDPEPVVKILDLGLALLGDTDQPRLTQMDHGAMGTAMYMSPEQWRTTSVDIRSDIYSLGCSLFHLLTGAPPFYDSDLKPEKAHERLAPPSVKGLPGVSKQLDAVVRKMLAKHPDERFQTAAEVAEALAPLAEGAELQTIIEKYQNAPADKTEGDAQDETHRDGPRVHDTQPSRRRPNARGWSSTYTTPVPTWRRWLNTVGTIGAMVAIVGLSFAVWNRDNGDRADMLTNVAVFAKESIDRDIQGRFKLLEDSASNSELIEAMKAIAKSTDDATADWGPAQRLVEQFSVNNDDNYPASSWFVTTAKGLQVAKAPYDRETVGETYWHRDYFHGLGKDLEKEPLDRTNSSETRPEAQPAVPAPIRGRHLSAVYRSDGSGKLKVALSTPIWSDENRPKDRKVLGVLGMSIELGDFRLTELSKYLSKGLEVVIADLRDGEILDGSQVVPEEGLLLHHPDLDRFKKAFHLPPKMLTDMEQEIERSHISSGRLIEGYPDLLGQTGAKFWGVYCPVEVPSRSSNDAKWVVLIQEEMR